MARILVVDDDAAIRETVALALTKAGHQVERTGSASAARSRLAAASFDCLVCDIYMPGENGVELLEELAASRPHLPVILMTARGTVETADLAARFGAADYLAKPFDLAVLIARVRSVVSSADAEADRIEPGPESMIVGSHPAIVEVYKAIARVARLSVPVLISGATGTGKELVARALHRFGTRPGGPFVPVNCGAIPDTLLESELFGHVRGAFTDARRDRRGALTLADGGTLFLDEIGDVSPSFQVKLLRFLQEAVVTPVGAEHGVQVDVRVVSATHRDLRALVAEGSFRQDLYFRLAGYDIVLPPLRERLTDLPLLVDHFARRSAIDLGLPAPPAPSRELLERLARHPWPGNVRELEHAVRRLLIDTRGLRDAAAADALLSAPLVPSGKAEAATAGDRSLEEADRRHIAAVLESTGGNRSAAARLLGIERKTLARKLRRLGISLEDDDTGRDEP